MKFLTNFTCHFTFAVTLFVATGNSMEVLSGNTDLRKYLLEATATYTTWLQENELDPSPPVSSVMKDWYNGVRFDCKISNHTMRGHSKTVAAFMNTDSSFASHFLRIEREATNDSLCEVHGNIDCTGILQAGEYFPELATDMPFSVVGDFHAGTSSNYDYIYMQNVGVTPDYKLDMSHSFAHSEVYATQNSFLLAGEFNDTRIDDVYLICIQDAFAHIYRGYGLNYHNNASFPSGLLFEQFVREIATNIDLTEIIEKEEDYPEPYVPTPSTTTTTTSSTSTTTTPSTTTGSTSTPKSNSGVINALQAGWLSQLQILLIVFCRFLFH